MRVQVIYLSYSQFVRFEHRYSNYSLRAVSFTTLGQLIDL